MGSVARRRAKPSMSSGVYVEPPPTIASFICRLAFDAGECDALDEHALGKEEDEDDRHHHEHGDRHGESPVRGGASTEGRQTVRHWPPPLVLGRVEEGAVVVVP